MPSVGVFDAELAHFAADAVDDDVALAVSAHEAGVVDALDARLADDRAGLESRVLRPLELRLLNLADVAEQVRRQTALRIGTGRHGQHVDAGQLELSSPHGSHLWEGRVLDDRDRPERRFATMPLDDFANRLFVDAGGGGEHAGDRVQIGQPLTHDRDRVGIAILHEHAIVAVEQHATRRAQRNRPLVVVVRPLQVEAVLHDLQDPEPDREHAEA